jgi:hypothetical protein
MEDKIKKLEIKKLLQEYLLLVTDDEYKQEVISEKRPIFLEKVYEMKKSLNIPIPPINENNIPMAEQVDDDIDPTTISRVTKNKVRNIYREIVKKTHPDKVNSEELIETYMRATKAAEKFNIIELFLISTELNIVVNLDPEDKDLLLKVIDKKKKDLVKINGSFIWLWINAENEEESENLIKMFVEQTSK